MRRAPANGARWGACRNRLNLLLAIMLAGLASVLLTSAEILGDWQFNEPAGSFTTADSSGNGYHGTLYDFEPGTGLTGDGQMVFSDNSMPPSYGNSISTELPLSLFSTNFTVDITFTYAGSAGRMWTPLLGSSHDPYSSAEIFYIGKNNLNTQLYLGLAGIYLGVVTPPVNLFDGAQHRLVVTYSRADGELNLYADGSGTPFATLAPNQPAGYFIGTSSLWIGGTGHAFAGGETWVGSLDRVIVRNSIEEEPIVITEQPTPVSALAGTVANLAVTVTGWNPRYQWYKDTVAIPNATDAVLVFDPLQPSDEGSYYVVVTNPISEATSETVAVTVTGADTTPPTVDLVEAATLMRVAVVFSERVSEATATDTTNYQLTEALSGTVEVAEASLAADGRTVTLTTAEALQDGEYTLFITGIQDLATPPNTIAEGTSASFSIRTLLLEYDFSGAAGSTTVTDLSGNGYTGTLEEFPAGSGLTGDGQVEFPGTAPRTATITTGLPQTLLAGDFTVDITFTYTGPDGGWYALIGSSHSPHSGLEAFFIGKDGNRELYIGIGGVASVHVPLADVEVFDGQQHRLVVTYSQTEALVRVFVDGSDTAAWSGAAGAGHTGGAAGQTLLIGNAGHADEAWDGTLDRVIVRNAVSIFEPPSVPLAFLSPVLVDGKIILDWTGAGRLEWAPSVLGPWEEVIPQPTTPPYAEDVVPGENRFFRLNAAPARLGTLLQYDFSGAAGSTTVTDLSGNGYTGTLEGFTTAGGLTGDGQVVFVDRTSTITTGLSQTLLSGDFTVDIIFTYTGPPSGWAMLVGCSQPTWDPSQTFQIGVSGSAGTDRSLYMQFVGVGTYTAVENVAVFDGQKRRLVVTYSQADQLLSAFVDGSDTAAWSIVAGSGHIGTQDILIGNAGHANESFIGSIHAVAISDECLDPSQFVLNNE